jgi:hypothetical protein
VSLVLIVAGNKIGEEEDIDEKWATLLKKFSAGVTLP